MERRLAAILSADVVGYSRLMAADEEGTLAQLKAHRKELIEPKTAAHQGRVVKLMGDGTLMEFASVVDALKFAIDVQRAMAERNAAVPDDRRVVYRVGINIGDIIVDGDDIYGDGVNVAARLQELADPGGIHVSRTVVDHAKGKVDLAFEDLGEQALKNIPEPIRVYRVPIRAAGADTVVTGGKPTSPAAWKRPALVAATATLIVAAGIALWMRPWEPTVEPTSIELASVERMAFPQSDKPSIAVLPFTNMSGDPEQEYFADGITEDLITDLSKISGLFVIARNSSFSYKGQQVKVRQVAEELGVRYVLEGSVRRVGDQVRINAQLIDATTGGHLWAERYDGSMADVFSLQDKVTQQIVTALAVTLTADEQAARAQTETVNPAAYDAFLRGWELYRNDTPEDYAAAIPFLKKAIKLDPDYGRAHAALAAVYWSSFKNRWTRSLGLSLNQALVQASVYLREAMKHPTALAHQIASERAAFYRRRADEAIEEAERALALDANDPAGYLAMANALIKAGRPDEAVDQLHGAMRLDPHYPADYLSRLGRAQFAMEAYHDAVSTFELAASRNPEDDGTFVYLGAAYSHLGRDEEAKAAVKKANALRANVGWSPLTLENVGRGRFNRSPSLPERDLLREGLGKVGVPTGGEWAALVTTTSSGAFDVKGATMVDASAAKALHDRKVPFVDVTFYAFPAGHISRAYWLLLSDEFDEARLLDIVAKTEEVVIYGRPENRMTTRGCAKAVAWGFQKVHCFMGGLDAWREAGHPVETGN